MSTTRARSPRLPRLVEAETHPGDVAPAWAEHVQGAAAAGGYWFVTQVDRLWRFPLDLDLARVTPDEPEVARVGIPEAGIDHLGDCDTHEDRLYVAMEGTDPARIGVFDLDLRFLGSAPVPPQGPSNPWCAVDPRNGLLYSSPFDTDHVTAYQPSWSAGRLTLEPVRGIALRTQDGEPLRLERVQGGAISDRGHLYLTSDVRSGGIVGIDLDTGRRGLQVAVTTGPERREKRFLEGLTIVDLRGHEVPWMAGVLHVLVLQMNHEEPDRVWFRHYDVADERDRSQF